MQGPAAMANHQFAMKTAGNLNPAAIAAVGTGNQMAEILG